MKKRLLTNLISYCLLTVLAGLIAYAVAPGLMQSCLAGVGPPTSGPNISKDDTGNYISDGDMRGDAQPILPPSTPQQATITGYLPQDWQDWSGWAKLTAHYDVVAQGCHTAGPCTRIDVPRLDQGYLTFAHWMDLPQGAYAASLWVRSSGRSAVEVTLRDNGDKTGTHQFSQKLVAGPAWQQVNLSGRCVGWDTAALTVNLYSGGASLWVGDVRLERKFDWVSALLLLSLVAVGVGLTHLINLIMTKIPVSKSSMREANGPVPANGSMPAESAHIQPDAGASTDRDQESPQIEA